MNNPILKSEKDCVGCLACLAVCPKDAILLKYCDFGAKIPYINEEKCIGCKKCERVCHYSLKTEKVTKKAYVAINKDKALLEKSASGGVFSAFAKLVLSKGGAVFGAALSFTEDGVRVKHECVETLSDLPGILGSKYVQSDCTDAFPAVKQLLKEGRAVLFGGTSCQVKALYAYLDGVDISELYTVDLICHGVPSVALLNEYIRHLESKYDGKITDLTFRTKRDGTIKYEFAFTVRSTKGGKDRSVTIPLKKSAYYRMFLGAESYQKACYCCDYASVDKPADITAGDYFEIKDDYPELVTGKNALKTDLGVSSIIVHSEKGYALLNEAREFIDCIEVDIQKVVRSHSQLQKPTSYKDRSRLIEIHKSKGFAGIERFYRKKDILNWKENLSAIIGRNNIRKLKRIAKKLLRR